MRAAPLPAEWFGCLVALAATVTAVAFAAALVAPLLPRCAARAAVWKAAFLGLGLLVALELSGAARGAAHGLTGWLATETPPAAHGPPFPGTSEDAPRAGGTARVEQRAGRRRPIDTPRPAGDVRTAPLAVRGGPAGDADTAGVPRRPGRGAASGTVPGAKPRPSHDVVPAEPGEPAPRSHRAAAPGGRDAPARASRPSLVEAIRRRLAARATVRDGRTGANGDALPDDDARTAPEDRRGSRAGPAPQPPGPSPSRPAGAGRGTWWPGLVWGLGAALLLARRAAGTVLLLALRSRRRDTAERATVRRVRELAGRVGLRRAPRVVEVPGAAAPFAFGVLRPAVAVPPGLERRYGPGGRDAVLVHELAHIARGDPAWSLLADGVTACLWWHPLVWFARRALRAECEFAADEASEVLDGGPAALAECLVALGVERARQPRWRRAALLGGPASGMAGAGFRSPLGRRVVRLLRGAHRRGPAQRPARAAAAVLSVSFLVAAVATGATAWIHLPASGDPVMNATRRNAFWKRSIAGLAVAAVLGPAGTPRAEASEADGSKPTEDRPAQEPEAAPDPSPPPATEPVRAPGADETAATPHRSRSAATAPAPPAAPPEAAPSASTPQEAPSPPPAPSSPEAAPPPRAAGVAPPPFSNERVPRSASVPGTSRSATGGATPDDTGRGFDAPAQGSPAMRGAFGPRGAGFGPRGDGSPYRAGGAPGLSGGLDLVALATALTDAEAAETAARQERRRLAQLVEKDVATAEELVHARNRLEAAHRKVQLLRRLAGVELRGRQRMLGAARNALEHVRARIRTGRSEPDALWEADLRVAALERDVEALRIILDLPRPEKRTATVTVRSEDKVVLIDGEPIPGDMEKELVRRLRALGLPRSAVRVRADDDVPFALLERVLSAIRDGTQADGGGPSLFRREAVPGGRPDPFDEAPAASDRRGPPGAGGKTKPETEEEDVDRPRSSSPPGASAARPLDAGPGSPEGDGSLDAGTAGEGTNAPARPEKDPASDG